MSQLASNNEVKTQPVQKNETPEHQLIPLTDKTLVTILIAHDCSYSYHKGAGKTFFYFDPKETHELREAWKLNKPIPITDVRKIYQALDSFHSAVRDY